jgi:hypothetical protein
MVAILLALLLGIDLDTVIKTVCGRDAAVELNGRY